MSNNAARLFLAALIAVAPAVVRGQEADPGAAYEPPANRSSLPEEAARAVFGRVFGVQGEGGDVRYYTLEMSNRSPLNAGVRSALVPGWGQFFNGQKVKGTLVFATFAGALFASVRLYEKADESLDDYRAKGVKNDAVYDDYSRQHTQAGFLAGAAAVVYLIGIFDAYRNAYSPLYGADSSVDVAWAPDGAEVRLKKRF